MSETETALVRRRTTTLDRRELLRQRFVDSRERLRMAVSDARQVARDVTPAARIREDPWRWVLGAVAVGFLLARLTTRRRRR